jgi:hypothetical protein
LFRFANKRNTAAWSAGSTAGSVRGAQRRHRDRVRIIRIVLVRPTGRQQPRPGRQRRWNIQHAFTRGDELLREEIPDATRRLDRPPPIRVLAGPRQQLADLAARGPHPNRRQLDLVTIDRDRGMRSLVWIDSNRHSHRALLPSIVKREPRWALLISEDRARRTSFEPHHGEIR